MRSLKGSFTVEASIVFSVVFILVAVLVYVFIIMYQYCALQSTANKAANTGAYYYVNPYGTEYVSGNGSNLYWRILDSHSEEKKHNLEDYISQSFEAPVITSSKHIETDTSYTFLLRQLNVGIIDQYRLPAGDLFSVFGITPELAIKAEAVSPLDDNAEFVRNLDMVIDIKNCILNSDNKWIGSGSTVSDIVGKLISSK